MNNKQTNNISKPESYLLSAAWFINYLMVGLVSLIGEMLIAGSIASVFLCLIMYIQTNGDTHSTLAPFLFGVPMAVIGMATLMLRNVLKEQPAKFDNETSSRGR